MHRRTATRARHDGRASTHPTDSWPVVVAGAGPAGLVAAITLARAGIRCLVLNRRTAGSSHPRATVVSLRSMELMRSWGLQDAILAGGDDVEWQMLLTTTLADAAAGQTIEVGLPTNADSDRLSPTRPACVPQDHLEAVLLEHLRGLPAARVEFGVAVEQVWQSQRAAVLSLRDAGSDEVRRVSARYVVGADGASSSVRAALGIAAPATDRLVESLSVLLHAPLWDVVGEHRYGIYAVGPQAPGSFLPAGHGDRWLYAFEWDPGSESLADYPHDRLITRIRSAAGVPALPVRIVDVRTFAFTATIAERFSDGRVFLVGDAVHRVTPRGGTGMNTAIGSAYSLGWKLAWVLNGWAPESLLDTYETERRPVAEHNVTRSIDPAGTRRPADTELRVDLGGRLAHQWLGNGADRISTLDLLGPGITRLIAEHDRSAVGRPTGPPVRVRRIDADVAAALGADRPGGIALRPDGLPWLGPDRRARSARPTRPGQRDRGCSRVTCRGRADLRPRRACPDCAPGRPG